MERYDFRTQRLFLDAPLSAGKQIEADRGQSNYLLNVLRLKENARILVFNGRDGEWLAQVNPIGRKACTLELVERTREQPEPPTLLYCFAPLKSGRLDYMVQKAVEMGAGILQPVITHHTQFSKVNMEKVRANTIEAAEQCGILSIPECREPVRLPKLLDDWDEGRVLIFADESADEANPVKTLMELEQPTLKALLVGPEGGFSADERRLLLACSFVVPISLGPRILRADTAAVAGLAVLQAVSGDW